MILLILYISLHAFNFIYNKYDETVKVSKYIKYRTTYNYHEKGLLIIPKINLKTILQKANDDFSNLDNSLVYYKDLDINKRIIIFGHSGAGYGTYFNRINELDINDNVYLYNKEYEYNYIVCDKLIISKYDVSILRKRYDKSELYLITCIKNKQNKRLLIKLSLKSAKIAQKIRKK